MAPGCVTAFSDHEFSGKAMTTETFLWIAGPVLLGCFILGLAWRPAPRTSPLPQEEFHRWAIYRFRLDHLQGGGGAVVEAVPGGPILFARRPMHPRRPHICLTDQENRKRIRIDVSRFFRRMTARISLDGNLIAILKGGRRGSILDEVEAHGIDFQIQGNAAALELEARREGKLISSLSPEIASSPGAVGAEVLLGTDPRPLIAVHLGICVLRLLTGPYQPSSPEPAPMPPKAAVSAGA